MADQYPLPPFAVTVAGVETAVRDGISRAMTGLAPLHLGADEAGTVELVLAEALNNVVEHALAGKCGATRIEIRFSHGAQGLEITLADEGAPMPSGKVPGARAPVLGDDVAQIPEGGFGWFMIHTLAQDIKYMRVGHANHLTLRLAVGL
jgi:serine/threonine-protein kinase RsbW